MVGVKNHKFRNSSLQTDWLLYEVSDHKMKSNTRPKERKYKLLRMKRQNILTIKENSDVFMIQIQNKYSQLLQQSTGIIMKRTGDKIKTV